jgi:hypothetical protein
MRVQISAFWAPKAGNSASEYEDAFSVPNEPIAESASIAFAAADGATETSFAGLWANLLVRSYGRKGLDWDCFDERVEHCRKVWKRAVGSKVLPWYAEEKVRSGAFSSIVGVTLYDGLVWKRSGTWHAIAVGDSCLFQVSDHKLVNAFPLEHSNDFSSRPVLLGSVLPGPDATRVVPCSMKGKWDRGDLFYLMTDALACWFLKHVEGGADPSTILSSVTDQTSFDSLVATQRQNKEIDGIPALRNDDVTLVISAIL